jgi:hypothetical protein
MKVKNSIQERLHTKSGETYWDEKGAYSALLKSFYKRLVPAMGKADTLHGELIRCVSNLNHEYFNNGNCNACEPYYADPEYDVDDNDEEYCINEGEIDHIDIDDYFNWYLNFIQEKVCVEGLVEYSEVKEIVDGVRYVILQASNYETCGGYFQKDFTDRYSRLIDIVMYVVENTYNEALES